MLIFLKEYIFVLMVTVFYGLVGGFSILPFRAYIKYPIMCAPMAGLLLSALGVFLLYSFAKLPVSTAIILVGLSGSVITILSLIVIKPSCSRSDIAFLTFLFLIFGVITTLLMNYASIQYKDFGLLYFGGTDHLGYVPMADWLNTHLVTDPPRSDPALPYQSFPSLLLAIDQRFGSFFTLATIATLFKKPSFFTYDIACSIILLINYLSIAGFFARSRKTLLLLIFAFMTSFWFNLAQTGFFGKIIGFTSIIFILGLYVIQSNDIYIKQRLLMFIMTILFAFAAAITYPGRVMAFFLMSIGGITLVIKTIELVLHYNEERFVFLIENALLLFILILTGFAANGLLMFPSLLKTTGDYPFSWFVVLLHQLDIRYFPDSSIFSWYSNDVSIVILILALVIMIVVLCVALFKKNVIAITLISAVMALLIAPSYVVAKWIAYQLSGTLYPLFACGLAWLIDDTLLDDKNNKIMLFFLFSLFIITILIRVPSFVDSIDRFAVSFPATMQYSQTEMSYLAKSIDNKSVIVDVPNVSYGLPLLAEFGRQNKNLQWTPESWKQILGYRTWLPPKLRSSQYLLGLSADALKVLGLNAIEPEHCDEIAKTKQYRLFACQNQITSAVKPLTYIDKIVR